ncbi:MAG: Uma2 family endonuclease [Chloroflexota bacterium]|nr:Uma2 family endonuclease [Chloroflexota bacterium]
MVVDPQRMRMSVDEYLAYDRASEVKHEYGDGEVIALAGGTIAHNDFTVNMVLLLREQLGRRGPCYAYASDLRVLVAKNHYFYPDVVVSCDIADRQEGSDIIRTPHLVVEVLSPSTEAKDRGYKLRCYQQCSSIQEYVLVNTHVQRVDIYRRQAGGTWLYQSYGAGQDVMLDSLDIHFPMTALYGGLRIPIEQSETG